MSDPLDASDIPWLGTPSRDLPSTDMTSAQDALGLVAADVVELEEQLRVARGERDAYRTLALEAIDLIRGLLADLDRRRKLVENNSWGDAGSSNHA